MANFRLPGPLGLHLNPDDFRLPGPLGLHLKLDDSYSTDWWSAEVYWTARDLGDVWDFKKSVGNHHYILILLYGGARLRVRDAAASHSPAAEGKVRFLTLAGHQPAGALVFRANDTGDVAAVREWLNSDKHVTWYRPDYDTECHRIASPEDGDFAFARKLVRLAENYHKNTEGKGFKVEYVLRNENCAAWVNTLLKAAGLSKQERLSLGEFSGIDWGEEDELDVKLFLD